MPTETPAIDSRMECRARLRTSGSPLEVLARIPRVSSESELKQAAEMITPPAGLTHFEYLMGDFELRGDEASPLAAKPRPDLPPATPVLIPAEVAEPNLHSELKIAAQQQEPRPSGTLDWTEAIMRLDAAIEPYSRAIVLMVLLAMAAFSLLLLRVSSDEAPSRAPLVQAQPLATAPKFKPMPESRPKARVVRVETPPKEVIKISPPQLTARGPVGMSPPAAPPAASLGTDIMPTSPEMEAETSAYPASDLPLKVSNQSPTTPTETATREARLRGTVTPIQPYK